jgi:hypothetical protein
VWVDDESNLATQVTPGLEHDAILLVFEVLHHLVKRTRALSEQFTDALDERAGALTHDRSSAASMR